MRGNFLLGIAVGVGAALFGPTLWRSGRPAIKKLVRAGAEGYQVASVAAVRFSEEVEDLLAEVAHEMKDLASDVGARGEDVIHGKGNAGGPAS